jgi:thioredoxin 2
LKLDDRGVLVPCPSCSTTNRLPYRSLERPTRCGRCRATLSAPSAPIEVSDPTAFDALVSQSSVPVIADFWAQWCGPCHMMAPELETVARHLAGAALVVKVNTDEQTELAERFRIRSLPTIAVFRGGREGTRVAGARPASEIETLVSESTHASTKAV